MRRPDGVGLLLSQIVKLRGGRVIGRVSNADKVSAAQAARSSI